MPKTKKIPSATEADQQGAFVPWRMIDDIDIGLSTLFVTIEAVRHFMDESDDGSLEWQLLRNALPETFYDLLGVLDRAGVLETTSRYPIAARAANRSKNQHTPPSSSDDLEKPQPHLAPPYAVDTWAEMVVMGRQLMIRFLLEKALAENNERRVTLLQGATEVARRGVVEAG
ncbi:MAG: hypothetical protein JWQ98_1269 [Chlorobi bacterium]|nr:hypothetical protein [Chlorobiota bacterium]